MLYSPWKVAFFGIFVWLFIWLTEPFSAVVTLSRGAMWFIAGGYLAFFMGCLVAELTRSHAANKAQNAAAIPWDGPFQEPFFWLTAVVGMIGMGARFYDRAVLRGVDYTANSADVRDALANTGLSPLSAVGGVLLPFCFLPLIFLLGSRWKLGHVRYLIVAIVIFSLPTIESLAQLSRSIMVISLVFALFAIGILKFGGRLATGRIVVPGIVILLLTLTASSMIFNKRLDDYGRTLKDSLSDSVFTENFYVTPDLLQKAQSGSGIEQLVYGAILPTEMYYTHSVYEFTLLWDRPDTQVFGKGLYTFSPYFRIAGLIFGADRVPEIHTDDFIYRSGVFLTFFGAWWVDFSYGSIMLLVALGFGVTRIGEFVRRGQLNLLPFYLFLLVVIFLIPVDNMISAGIGFFMLHGFGLFALFTTFGSGGRRANAGQTLSDGNAAV